MKSPIRSSINEVLWYTEPVSTSAPSRSAFSLLELIVALAILAVGIVAAVGSMVTAVNTDTATSERDLAIQAIESMLEDIRASGFGNATKFENADGTPKFYPVVGLNTIEGQTDPLEVSVEDVPGFVGKLRIIDLTASWDGKVAPESITLRYVLSNQGG